MKPDRCVVQRQCAKTKWRGGGVKRISADLVSNNKGGIVNANRRMLQRSQVHLSNTTAKKKAPTMGSVRILGLTRG